MHKLLKNDTALFLGLGILFVLLNAIGIAKEIYVLNALPFAFGVVWFALRSMDKLIFTIIFFTPLSLPLSEYIDAPIDMFLPTEPLLVGVLFLFIILLPTKKYVSPAILKHPITQIIIAHLIWMLFTTFTSTMPVVSLKFLAVRLWFIIAFYYLLIFIILKNPEKYIERIIWLFALPMIIVIIYALYRHATLGIFQKKIAHWAANPFFKDHTIYGAVLAIYIPVLITMLFQKGRTLFYRYLTFIIAGLYIIATVFSYSRAAWLSLIGAFVLFILIRFKVKFQYLAFFGGVVLLFLALSWTQIMIVLQTNRQDSAVDNFGDHVQSVSNISSDASNMERLNRWGSAFRMFADKPLVGYGPGTYMFQYGPYQMSYEKTIISTNAGDMGNAHSEYFGPLSEQGVPGMLLFLLLGVTVIVIGIRLYQRLTDQNMRLYVLGAVLGLFTYFLHGFLNNFLDTDKASAPFWGLMAIIVALDLWERGAIKREG